MAKKLMTEDEWVKKLNALARKMDEWATAVHPSAWEADPYFKGLKEEWLKLAKAKTRG